MNKHLRTTTDQQGEHYVQSNSYSDDDGCWGRFVGILLLFVTLSLTGLGIAYLVV